MKEKNRIIRSGQSITQGMSLIELMVTLGIMAGFVLIDIEHHRNVLVTRKKQVVAESLGSLEGSLQGWLRQRGVISDSFGQNAGAQPSRVSVLTGVVSNFQREKRTSVNDNFAITSIRQRDTSVTPPVTRELISQREIEGVRLMGPVGGGTVRSLDGGGWAYIRTMWLQDFNPYHGWEEEVEGSGDTRVRTGSANLKVLVWKYVNIFEKPGLNCVTENNCEREVLTIPIELRLLDQNASDGTDDNLVIDGSFGVQCRNLASAVPVENVEPCGGNEFFRAQSWSAAVRSGRNAVVSHTGQCCRLVQ